LIGKFQIPSKSQLPTSKTSCRTTDFTDDTDMEKIKTLSQNVILNGAKNLGSNPDRSTNKDRQRCFALLNMTPAPMKDEVLNLLIGAIRVIRGHAPWGLLLGIWDLLP